MEQERRAPTWRFGVVGKNWKTRLQVKPCWIGVCLLILVSFSWRTPLFPGERMLQLHALPCWVRQEHLKGDEEEDGSRSICLRARAALSRPSPARGALQHPQCVCQPWDTCGHYIRGRAQSVVVCAAGRPSVLPLMCGCRGQGQRGDVPACAGGRDCGLCAR